METVRNFRPSRLANGLYAVRILVVPGAMAAAVLWTGWPWVVQSALLGLLGLALACGFPRHHLNYTLRMSDDGFDYLPWVGRRRSVRWDEVTAYRHTWTWLRLVRDDGRVHFLFERPLVIRDRAAFLAELKRRCPTATRLGWIDWWKLVGRGAREALRPRG
jgi:hypothetical protein